MRSNILELSKKFVSIPSVNTDTKSIQKTLDLTASELRDFKFKRYKKNGITSMLFHNKSVMPKAFEILLNAHLDVVPGSKVLFKPIVKDSKLFGRGTYDMKCAAAAMINIFKEIAKKVNYPLGLQIVTDEEKGGFSGTKYQIDTGVRTKFVISGEPTDMNICIKTKGVLSIEIETHGKSAHAAQPWQGENALVKIMDSCHKILIRFSSNNGKEWKTTASLSWIRTTNNQGNLVPDYAAARFDIRFIPEDKENIIKEIKKLIPKDIILSIIVFESAMDINSQNKYVELLSSSINKTTGKLPKLIKQHFSSDIRHFSNIGISGVLFGPRGFGPHTEEEYVEIESLDHYCLSLREFLVSIKKLY